MSKLTQRAAFKAKLDAKTDEEKNALLHFLPESEIAKIQGMPSFDVGMIDTVPIFAYLGKIHPSWFETLFDPMTKKDKKLFISAFSQRREELASAFGLEQDFIELTHVARRYIIQHVYQFMLGSTGMLPFSFLSNEPHFNLLTLSYPQLVELIDLLALHDIALEVKNLLHKGQIKALHHILDKKQLKYLKGIKNDSSGVSFGKMGLASWDGNEKELRYMMHKRGLNRLAKTLTGASESFIGHLYYLLSKDEAKIFKSFTTDKKNENVVETLNKQLEAILEIVLKG